MCARTPDPLRRPGVQACKKHSSSRTPLTLRPSNLAASPDQQKQAPDEVLV